MTKRKKNPIESSLDLENSLNVWVFGLTQKLMQVMRSFYFNLRKKGVSHGGAQLIVKIAVRRAKLM